MLNIEYIWKETSNNVTITQHPTPDMVQDTQSTKVETTNSLHQLILMIPTSKFNNSINRLKCRH